MRLSGYAMVWVLSLLPVAPTAAGAAEARPAGAMAGESQPFLTAWSNPRLQLVNWANRKLTASANNGTLRVDNDSLDRRTVSALAQRSVRDWVRQQIRGPVAGELTPAEARWRDDGFMRIRSDDMQGEPGHMPGLTRHIMDSAALAPVLAEVETRDLPVPFESRMPGGLIVLIVGVGTACAYLLRQSLKD